MTNHALEAARKIAERPSIVASHDHNLNARIRSQNEWCDKVEHAIQAAIDAATADKDKRIAELERDVRHWRELAEAV